MAINGPPIPFWLTVTQGVQLLLAVLTLALSAYSLYVFGNLACYSMNIFTSILNLIYIIYIGVSTLLIHDLYIVWASIGLQALLFIFWLTTFGLLATLSAAFDAYGYGYYYSAGEVGAAIATTKAATALTALLWASFLGTLIFTVMTAIRHQKDSAPATAAAPVQEHMVETAPGQPAPGAQPQQYVQQPYVAPGQVYQQQQYAQQPYPVQQAGFQQQQPVGYPQPTGSPAPYQQPVQYPQPTGSPAPYQQPVQYPQQTGSPPPVSPVSYPQPTGSPAPYPVEQQRQPQELHEQQQQQQTQQQQQPPQQPQQQQAHQLEA